VVADGALVLADTPSAPSVEAVFGSRRRIADAPAVEAPVQAPVEASVQAPVQALAQASSPVQARRARASRSVEARPVEAPLPVEARAVEAPSPVEALPVEAPSPVESVVAESVPVDGGPSDAAPADGGPTEAATGESPRRSRNRRRGRRGGDRGPRPAVEGAPVDAEAATEIGAAEAPLDEAPRPPPPDVGEVFAQVLSGAFDVEPAAEEAALSPPKRVLAAEPDAPKLHKVLAQAGVGSRRDMEQMIVEGKITVNGDPAHIGQRISFGDRIAIGGKPVRFRIAPPPPRVLAYHKPAGEVVTHDDPQQRPTVFRRLPRLQQGKWQSVGRLDINTEGLLLFTNSGALANQLMHPRFGVEREYAVRSLGLLGVEAKAKLIEGVEIDGQHCAFKSVEDGGGEGANHWYRCVITEGRNREVRKLFEAVGHAVSRLIRIRYGSVVLPRGLKRGVWVDLDDFDVRSLRRITGDDERDGQRDGPRGPDRDRSGGGGDRGDRGNRRGAKRGRNGPADGNVAPRGPRGPRPDMERGERIERPERGEGGAIPNPLQQTFDKRAIQQERALRRDMPEDGPIPNPLQQTYDKRALQRDRAPQRDIPEDGPIPNPLQQTYDKRFAQGAPNPHKPRGAGNDRRGKKPGGANANPNGNRQPDPMKTSVGYIGGDAFLRKAAGRGGPRGGRSGGGGGGGGGGTGGGPGGGGNRGGRGR